MTMSNADGQAPAPAPDGPRGVLRVPLSGAAAKIVTRAYHLYALPANRLRVATDWFNDVVERRQFVRLGLIQPERSGLAVAEHTDIYYRTDGRPLERDRRG